MTKKQTVVEELDGLEDDEVVDFDALPEEKQEFTLIPDLNGVEVEIVTASGEVLNEAQYVINLQLRIDEGEHENRRLFHTGRFYYQAVKEDQVQENGSVRKVIVEPVELIRNDKGKAQLETWVLNMLKPLFAGTGIKAVWPNPDKHDAEEAQDLLDTICRSLEGQHRLCDIRTSTFGSKPRNEAVPFSFKPAGLRY